jgi:aldehyde dehydrogenase (NAD+)
MDLTKLTKQYIGGKWRDGTASKPLVVSNPFTDEAYEAAKAAQPAWELVTAHARRFVFEKAAEIVTLRHAEIADLIIKEVGGTALKAAFETSLVVEAIKDASTTAFKIHGSIIPSPVPDRKNLSQGAWRCGSHQPV